MRSAVEQIGGILQEQSSACGQVTEFLDGVAAGSRSNADATEGLRSAIAELTAQAIELREDAARFRG